MKTASAILLSAIFSSSVFATGLPVIDAANLTQNAMSAVSNVQSYAEIVLQYAKQVEQYKTQLEQYKTQLQNLAKLGQYNWSDTSKALEQGIGVVGQVNNASTSAQNFLQTFKSIQGWDQAKPTAATVQASATTASNTEIAAYAASAENLAKQQANMTADAAKLSKMIQSAQSADGQLKALQASAQLATEQINQLGEIRALLIHLSDVTTARNASLANKEASEAAATKQSMSRPMGNYTAQSMDLKIGK